jgi:hypothetical protein
MSSHSLYLNAPIYHIKMLANGTKQLLVKTGDSHLFSPIFSFYFSCPTRPTCPTCPKSPTFTFFPCATDDEFSRTPFVHIIPYFSLFQTPFFPHFLSPRSHRRADDFSRSYVFPLFVPMRLCRTAIVARLPHSISVLESTNPKVRRNPACRKRVAIPKIP